MRADYSTTIFNNNYYDPYYERSCIREACTHGGANCSLDADLSKVIQLCRYTSNECVRVACDKTGDCALSEGLQKILRACEGVDGQCVKAACDVRDGCGLQSELFKIIGLCRYE